MRVGTANSHSRAVKQGRKAKRCAACPRSSKMKMHAAGTFSRKLKQKVVLPDDPWPKASVMHAGFVQSLMTLLASEVKADSVAAWQASPLPSARQ